MRRSTALVGLTLLGGAALTLGSSTALAAGAARRDATSEVLATFGEVVSPSASGYDLVYAATDGNFQAGTTVYGHTDMLFSAGTFVGNDFSKQYLIEAATGDLYTANTTTGEVLLVGATGMHGTATNLRWQYVSNIMVATDPAPDCSSTSIYTVDPDTAVATLIQTVDALCVTSLAIIYTPNVPGTIYMIDGHGVLYGLATPADAVQEIGAIGLGLTPPAPMDFSDQQQLYLHDFGDGGFVYGINVSDGAAQEIGVETTTVYALAYGFAPTDLVFVDGFEVPQ